MAYTPPFWQEIPASSCRVFFDTEAARAQVMASRFDGRAAGALEELLSECDAAFVCTPNTTHVEVAMRVLEAGKHVFCEKPFALNLESATRLRDRAMRARVVYQVGHDRRFAPVYKVLKISDQRCWYNRGTTCGIAPYFYYRRYSSIDKCDWDDAWNFAIR